MTKGYWQSGAVDTPPKMETLSSHGYPTAGDKTRGIAATTAGAGWFYLIDTARNSVIEAAGKTLATPPDPKQFLEALATGKWLNAGAIEERHIKSLSGSKLTDASVAASKLEKTIDLAKSGIMLAHHAYASTSERLRSTPSKGEIVYDAEAAQYFGGDGSTKGGIPLGGDGGGIPSGMSGLFFGNKVPDGWLLCNGAAVSRTKYSDLFEAIGTTYGKGDGSTTFNLPNADKRFLECTTDRSQVGKYVEPGLPNITGEACVKAFPEVFESGAIRTPQTKDCPNLGGSYRSAHKFVFDASLSDAIFGRAPTVQPSSLRLLACIKI